MQKTSRMVMKKIKLLFKMVLLGLFLIGCVFRSQERVCAAEMEVECVLKYVIYVGMILTVNCVRIQKVHCMEGMNAYSV